MRKFICLFPLALLLCSCGLDAERRVTLSACERRVDGAVTSATLTTGQRPALIGEHRTSATLALPSGAVMTLYDEGTKDAAGQAWLAGFGVLGILAGYFAAGMGL